MLNQGNEEHSTTNQNLTLHKPSLRCEWSNPRERLMCESNPREAIWVDAWWRLEIERSWWAKDESRVQRQLVEDGDFGSRRRGFGL